MKDDQLVDRKEKSNLLMWSTLSIQVSINQTDRQFIAIQGNQYGKAIKMMDYDWANSSCSVLLGVEA